MFSGDNDNLQNLPDIVRTTHLELSKPSSTTPSLMLKGKTAIMHLPKAPCSFYRYLYSEIGAKHHWYSRLKMDDKRLGSIIHDENLRILVLYRDGAPAGFADLEYANHPISIEIGHFGILPDFQGQSLGKWFFGQILKMAWEDGPDKIIISTKNTDHPRALPLYQKAGFQPVSVTEMTMQEYFSEQNSRDD